MRYRLELIVVVAIIIFAAVFLYIRMSAPGAEFAGSDTAASAQVAALTGRDIESFTPLVPQWRRPGPEVESALFALQAACGGLVAGYIFGRWKGESEQERPG